MLIFGFIMLPLSATSALLFSALMGLLWLSTAPLTSGLVAAGKAKKLALTAAMRKLVVTLYARLRDRQPWRAQQSA